MPSLPLTVNQLLAQVRDSLAQWTRWGCRGWECSPATLHKIESWSQLVEPGQPRAIASVPPAEDSEDSLARIQADLRDCQRCGLSRGRTHLVFGEGDPQAELVFVGEGPGYEEDRSGRPFVGRAGQLLTRIIEAMSLTRDQVYICNVVKCRPPKNRTPLPEEIKTCRPFLDRQLAVLKPRVICALGSSAAQVLLNNNAPISRLRGRFHDFAGIKLMPTFHPAFLLRNPESKREVWEDVKMIMELLAPKR